MTKGALPLPPLTFISLLECLFVVVDVVIEVMKNLPAWPGRHLVEGGDNFRYFALKTVMRGVVEFECRDQREHDVWTQGVSRLLAIAAERNNNRNNIY